MRRVSVYICLLCAIGSTNAQEALILPFDADSLTGEQKTQTPVYVAYPAALKDDVPTMKCEPKESVDLGLPSGLKWATCNIGAESPEDYGDFFAWGETEKKEEYSWNNYKWSISNDVQFALTKYNIHTHSGNGIVDNKTVLEEADDAAHANWGGSWRMPTNAEFTELREKCTWTWTTQNGIKGYKVTSNSNGNSIFLPAAGYCIDSSFGGAGICGFYWSSSLSTDHTLNAYYLTFYSSRVDWTSSNRFQGNSVRPVCP